VSAAAVTAEGPAPRPRPTWGPADLLTALRLPCAAAFVLYPDVRVRLAILAFAGASDLLDGYVARRVGPSRIGEVLDPVVDKIFILAAVLAVVTTAEGIRLGPWEIAGVLLRDIAVVAGFFVALVRRRRRVTIPARASGKAVSVLQFLTIAAILLELAAARPLAWTTAVASVWAIVDYARIALRGLRGANPGA
jgi:phosphatidylglycerophosphate synthase